MQVVVENSKVEKMCGGFKHVLLLLSDGRYVAVGENLKGELGFRETQKHGKKHVRVTGMEEEELEDLFCGGEFSLFLTRSGKLLGSGDSTYGQLGVYKSAVPIPRLLVHDRIIHQVACGDCHTVIMRKNGEIYSLGANFSGTKKLLLKNPPHQSPHVSFFSG